MKLFDGRQEDSIKNHNCVVCTKDVRSMKFLLWSSSNVSCNHQVTQVSLENGC